MLLVFGLGLGLNFVLQLASKNSRVSSEAPLSWVKEAPAAPVASRPHALSLHPCNALCVGVVGVCAYALFLGH